MGVEILIVGAGAIGGFIGGVLAEKGACRVTFVARGEHGKAIRERGLRLISDSHDPKKRKDRVIKGESLRVIENITQAAEIGPFDVSFIGVKSNQMRDIAVDAQAWKHIMGKDGVVVTTQNGIPFNFFLSRSSDKKFSGKKLLSVDPDGVLERAWPVDRVVGCIAMPAGKVVGHGFIEHEGNWALPLDSGRGGKASEHVKRVGQLLRDAGFKAEERTDFEEEIFIKSLGSAVFNPLSALTGATLGDLTVPNSPALVLVERGMNEVRAIANAIGVPIGVTNERRIAGARRLGHHKTSMLMDVEGGKSEFESAAIVGSLVEIAGWSGVQVPTLSTINLTLEAMSSVRKTRQEEEKKKKQAKL